MLELHRRDVDRDRDAVALLLPRARLPARLAQHPGADRQDQAGVLGDRNELVGLVQLASAHVPAQQGLGTHDLPAGGRDARLVVQTQLAARQGLAQRRLDAAAGARALVHRGGEEAAAVHALAAQRDQRGLGVLQQGFRIQRIVGIDADADAQMQPQRMQAVHPGLLALVDQGAGKAGRLAGAVERGEHHHELVAAVANQLCLGGQAALQLRHERAQHAVAGGLAVLVVDLLELVDVDVQQRHALLPAPRVGQRLGQVILQLAAVGQAGERVVLGQVHQLEREGARFADVMEYQHAADHVAGVVVDRRGGILHRRVEAVPMAQQGAAGQVGDGVVVDRGAQRVGHRPAVDGVEQLEHRFHRQALRLGAAPAGHCLGDRVERADARLRVGDDDRVADRAQGHLGQLALALQRILECLALADVLRLRHEVQRRALLVAHQRHGQLQVHHVAVLVQVAFFQLVVFALAGEQLQHLFGIGGHVVRVGDVGHAEPEQFLLGVTEHVAYRGVDAQETPARAGQRHADRGMLEGAEEAPLAFVQAQLQFVPLGDVDQGGKHAAHAAVFIEIGREVAVRVAPLATVEQLALVAGRMARVGLLQRRARTLVVGLADHLDQALADQLRGVDAEPATVGVVDVAQALVEIEPGEQHGGAMPQPLRPLRSPRRCRYSLGLLRRPHGVSVRWSAPPDQRHAIMRRPFAAAQLSPARKMSGSAGSRLPSAQGAPSAPAASSTTLPRVSSSAAVPYCAASCCNSGPRACGCSG